MEQVISTAMIGLKEKLARLHPTAGTKIERRRSELNIPPAPAAYLCWFENVLQESRYLGLSISI